MQNCNSHTGSRTRPPWVKTRNPNARPYGKTTKVTQNEVDEILIIASNYAKNMIPIPGVEPGPPG